MKGFGYDAGVYLLELLLKEGRSLRIGKMGELEFVPPMFQGVGGKRPGKKQKAFAIITSWLFLSHEG